MTSAKLFCYDHVMIDLDMRVAMREDGESVALVGRVYDLLETLLRRPGRIFTYWEIAQRMLPEWLEDCSGGWGHLSPRQRHGIKRVLQMAVLRARHALGDAPGPGCILLNRMNAGYGIRPYRTPELPADAAPRLPLHVSGARSSGEHYAGHFARVVARSTSADLYHPGPATRGGIRAGHLH
jgi:hypothetical protein